MAGAGARGVLRVAVRAVTTLRGRTGRARTGAPDADVRDVEVIAGTAACSRVGRGARRECGKQRRNQDPKPPHRFIMVEWDVTVQRESGCSIGASGIPSGT